MSDQVFIKCQNALIKAKQPIAGLEVLSFGKQTASVKTAKGYYQIALADEAIVNQHADFPKWRHTKKNDILFRMEMKDRSLKQKQGRTSRL